MQWNWMYIPVRRSDGNNITIIISTYLSIDGDYKPDI